MLIYYNASLLSVAVGISLGVLADVSQYLVEDRIHELSLIVKGHGAELRQECLDEKRGSEALIVQVPIEMVSQSDVRGGIGDVGDLDVKGYWDDAIVLR